MMDLADRRRLEIEVDRLMLSLQEEVIPLAREAQRLLKLGKYDDAQELVNKAAAFKVHPLPLMRAVVNGGAAKSLAEAKRMIQRGAVKVDGVVITKPELDVREATSITANGKSCLSK